MPIAAVYSELYNQQQMIHMRTGCKIALILLLFQEQGYTAPITLTLAKAIERALENNASMKSQRMSFKQAEMSYLDAWNAMFVPSVSLSFSTSSTYTVGDLEKNEELKSRKLHGFPSPRASLVIGSYTIFNFWKDWNNYENARLSWVRTQEQFQERLRSFRFSVSNSYFRSKIVQDNLEYSKRFYSLAESIHSLMQSRFKVKKATEEEVSSSEQDLLTSKIELNSSITSAQESGWAMNQLMADTLGTEYLLVDDPTFEPIEQDVEEILQIYKENAPRLKDLKLSIKNAEMAIDIAEKSRLPLPSVSFSGLTFSYLNQYQTLHREMSTDSGNKQLNVSASISLTLPIVGSGGFFSHRNIARSYMSLEQVQYDLRQALIDDEVTIRTLLRSIIQSEENIKDYKQSLKNSTKILDHLVNQGEKKSGKRLEFRDALKKLSSDQASLAQANMSHVASKYSLYEMLGVDQLEKKK